MKITKINMQSPDLSEVEAIIFAPGRIRANKTVDGQKTLMALCERHAGTPITKSLTE